ncbi:phage tail spike protein [Clostridium sp. C8-1-8]|uniref:phage tail spike protein n=1 Tax=Clostridium sp. C8-1-8 TaxID=2698831 RepID=UPI00136FDC3C|nr:phage tail spike protein [Clostridium sp. C8-1-8]
MINIYDKLANKNTVINTNGLAVLDTICLNARITEKMNGEYGLNATFIIDQEHNRHEYIEQETIIKCGDIYGDEVFRIAKLTKTLNGRIEIYARHITYDTNDMWLEDVRPTGQNGYHFLDWLFTHTTNPNSDFTYNSNITNEGTSYFLNKSIYNAIFDSDNSFLNTLGGEVARRQYNITINNQIGYDNGVSIRSRKNLTGFEAYTDIDTVITRIYPKGNNGLTIDAKYIDSPYISNYSKIKSAEIQFNIGVDEENGITEAIAKQRLLEEAQKKFSVDKVDILKAQYKINFVELSKTEEYKNYAVLERINLGDFVNVYEENFDINIKVRAVERYWNVLRQEHTSITLSNYAVQSNIATINKVINTINQFKDPQSGFLSQAYEQMKSGLSNSYVVCKQNEILAMNTKDKATATEGLQLTKDGLLGYSNGFNNPPNVAIMIDGTINGNMVRTGVIQSLDGTFRLDLGGGSLTTYDYNGKKAIKMVNQIIKFFNFNSAENEEVGRVTSGYYNTDTSKSGIAIMAPSEKFIAISKITGTLPTGQNTSEDYVEFDMGALGNAYPITLYKDVSAKGDFLHKVGDKYYYAATNVQWGNVWITTNQEVRINLDDAFNNCSFKTIKVSIIGTYRNSYNALGEFYLNSYYIENNQLVLKGGVTHKLVQNGSDTWVTDGQINVHWMVIGQK